MTLDGDLRSLIPIDFKIFIDPYQIERSSY